MKWIATLALCCFASTALAQDGHKHPGHGKQDQKPGHKHDGGQAEMDQNAMMEAWMQLGQPGPEHKHLEPMKGTWKATVKHWMAPGAEPMQSEGKCVNVWAMGGRYMRTSYKGDMMGMPFEGYGIAGYDRTRNEYFNIWFDSMSTGPMIDKGGYDPSTKTFTYHTDFMMPEIGKMKSKTVVRVESNDKHVMLMYQGMPGQDSMNKVMEIVYTRIKTDS